MGIGILIIGLLGVATGALLGALLVRFLVQKIARFRPKYSNVYIAVLIPGAALYLLDHSISTGESLILGGVWIFGCFLVYVASFVMLIKGSEGQKVSYKQAAMISLAFQLIIGFLMAVIWAIIWAVFPFFVA